VNSEQVRRPTTLRWPRTTDAANFPLIDVFSPEMHALVAFSEELSLPPSQRSFSTTASVAGQPSSHVPLGTHVLEPTLENFDANLFTNGLLRGLEWDGIVATGGAVLACAMHTGADTWGEPGSEEVEDARRTFFSPGRVVTDRTPSAPRCSKCSTSERRTLSGIERLKNAPSGDEPRAGPRRGVVGHRDMEAVY
jgi:hypothetical protein